MRASNFVILFISLMMCLTLICSCGNMNKKESSVLSQNDKPDSKTTTTTASETETKSNYSKPETSSSEYTIGQRIKLGNYILIVKNFRDFKSNDEFSQPKAGNKYVEADILIENGGSEPIDYNILDFKLQDNEGYSYNTAFGGSSEPSLSAGTLQKGQKTRGFVSFEIPKKNKAEQLTYTPELFSDDQIIIKLK